MLPDTYNSLSEEEKAWERELLRRRLVHFHYVASTEVENWAHHQSQTCPLNQLRRHVLKQATAAWEGETIQLLHALTDITHSWELFSNGTTPCPVHFTDDEVAAAHRLYLDVESADNGERRLMDYVGFAEDTWVPAADYEKAKERGLLIRQATMEACAQDEETTDESYAAVQASWPLDDMTDEELEEYALETTSLWSIPSRP